MAVQVFNNDDKQIARAIDAMPRARELAQSARRARARVHKKPINRLKVGKGKGGIFAYPSLPLLECPLAAHSPASLITLFPSSAHCCEAPFPYRSPAQSSQSFV